MVMRYLWLPFRLVLWAIPTALVSLFWNAHVRSAFATVGLVPLAGVPVWLQPLVVAPAVLSVAGLVTGLMLVPRWAAAIEGGDAGAWHYRTGWLFDLWAMAGLIAVAGFVTVGVVGSPDPLWGLGAVPALVGLGIVIVLCGLGIAAGVHGLVHDAITKGLTRRDPRTPGYRVFDGTAVPLNGALLTVPLTGQPAIGWYIEVTVERTGRLKTTSTFTERDMSSPIGQTTTTRTDRIKTSSFDRQILTHRLVPFAVAVRGGGQVIVPATAGFDGVPVTGELKVARDLPPDLYDRLREVGEKNGGAKLTYQLFALSPGTRVRAAGLVWLDDQGRPNLADHGLETASVAPR